MLKRKILLLTAILFLTAIPAIPQTTTEKQSENSALTTQQTPPADDLQECARLLNKTLDENKALKSEMEARIKEQTLSNQEMQSLRATVDALKAIISNQEKLIDILLNRSKTKIKVCLIC